MRGVEVDRYELLRIMDGKTTSELLEATGLPRQTLFDMLRQLRDAGYAYTEKRGRKTFNYLTEKGKNKLETRFRTYLSLPAVKTKHREPRQARAGSYAPKQTATESNRYELQDTSIDTYLVSPNTYIDKLENKEMNTDIGVRTITPEVRTTSPNPGYIGKEELQRRPHELVEEHEQDLEERMRELEQKRKVTPTKEPPAIRQEGFAADPLSPDAFAEKIEAILQEAAARAELAEFPPEWALRRSDQTIQQSTKRRRQ